MKKVSFIMAGLVSLLLVGCGGEAGDVTSTDTPSVNTPSKQKDDTTIITNSANNAALQDGLPSIPDIPAS